jgi:hypothetical protein
VELKTAITSGEKSTSLQDPKEDPRAEIRELSKRDVRQALENEDTVEMSAPSETKKEILHGVRARHVGAPATPGVTAPLLEDRDRKREKKETYDDCDNLH